MLLYKRMCPIGGFVLEAPYFLLTIYLRLCILPHHIYQKIDFQL